MEQEEGRACQARRQLERCLADREKEVDLLQGKLQQVNAVYIKMCTQCLNLDLSSHMIMCLDIQFVFECWVIKLGCDIVTISTTV